MRHQTNELIRSKRYVQILRTEPTNAERLLWQHLRARQVQGVKFRRQHAINDFIVDFVSFDVMVVIELDGGQHATQVSYDAARTQHLTELGFAVLRFWNTDVMQNTGAVLEQIHQFVAGRIETHPHPNPPLEGEGTEL